MVLVFIVFMWVVNYEDSKWHTQAIFSTIFYDAHLGTIGLNFHNKTMFFFHCHWLHLSKTKHRVDFSQNSTVCLGDW